MKSLDIHQKRKVLNGLLIIFGLTIAFSMADMYDQTANYLEIIHNDIYLNKSPADHFSEEQVQRLLLSLNLLYDQQYEMGRILPTGSMRPFIDSEHHSIWINVTSINELQVGDVIVFDVDETNVSILHRIIKIDNGIITTKGDNNLPRDNYNLTIENVLGKVVAVLY